MRVRISYSVDLEEVPTESVRMLKDTVDSLQVIVHQIQSLIQKIDDKDLKKEDLIGSVDLMKVGLATSDSKITDVAMIMTGYHDAQLQLAATKEPRVEESNALETKEVVVEEVVEDVK